MAMFRRKGRDRPAEETAPVRQILAAAIPLTGPEAGRYASARPKQTSEQWQKDAWYFYDAIGELTAPTTWLAQAVSKADLFGAETDPVTGLVTGPTEDARAQQAAAICLGGAARRAQLQYILAVCWQIPGEAYVVVRGRPDRQGTPQPDEWLVLSGRKVRPKGDIWSYEDPVTLAWIQLGGGDRLIRIWDPHPDDQAKANSPVRSALPVLREIEKASMNLGATLDSRLALVGIQLIPSEIDMPGRGDGQTNADTFADMLLRAASAGIEMPGTAAAQVPVVAEVPAEYIQAFKDGQLKPDTAVDATVVELRERNLSRLAAALPLPKSKAEGTQADANHWSSWQVEEDTYKFTVEPLLDRVGDALTEWWYRPALRAMGVEDPERHTLAWDVSGIVARPDATEDLNHLYDLGLISDDYRRQASGIPDDAIPSEDEIHLRRLERVVMNAPALAADPQVGQLLFGFEIAPAAAGVDPEAAGVSAGEELPTAEPAPNALPAAPGGPVDEGGQALPEGLVASAELLVFDALSRAGGRLLTREHRGQFASVKKHNLYMVVPPGRPAGELIEDSFLWADHVADQFGADPSELRTALTAYTTGLVTSQQPHDRGALRRALGA